MKRRIIAGLLVFGFASSLAAADCADCVQEGLAAKQRGEMDRALILFESGCQEGDGEACDAAAHMLVREKSVPWDMSRAIAIGRHACELGSWQGCGDIGSMIVFSNTPDIAADGRTFLAQACEGDDARACEGLGKSLKYGYGGDKDAETGARAMMRSCQLGYSRGCNGYALTLITGDADDEARARNIVRQTCDAGDAEGCGILGLAMRDGLGGPKDGAGAVQNLQRACDVGFVVFCSDLAVAYVQGSSGLEVDVERAAGLFKKACDGGLEKACNNLATLTKTRAKQGAQGERWTSSMENVSFSTKKSTDATVIGSMKIGQGDETATFSDVRSSCGSLQLTLSFGAAAGGVRRCLGDTDVRRVRLAFDDGRVTSAEAEPNDEAGRCVLSALAAASIGDLSCGLEASVSR